MSEDLARTWTVEALASTVGLSPSQLHRRFSIQVGRPVMAWLDQMRAERAAALLARTDTPVAAIGRHVGWGDPSYTSRRFRLHYGMTPVEYRRRFNRTD